MSFVTQAKEKFKKEYNNYKYNQQLENNPEVVREKLERARVEQRGRVQFARDKAELKELQGGNKFSNALSGLKSHLDSVKSSKQTLGKGKNLSGQKQQVGLGTGRNIIYDQSPTQNASLTLGNQPQGSKSLIMQDNKPSGSGVFGGKLGQQEVKAKKPKSSKGKTIVIKF